VKVLFHHHSLSITQISRNLYTRSRIIHSPLRHQPYHELHADRTDGDYYDSSEDIMKMDEGADSRLAGQYEIVVTQIP
jgi:hypothetical protein